MGCVGGLGVFVHMGTLLAANSIGFNFYLAQTIATVVAMTAASSEGPNLRYRGAFSCGRAGRYGFTVRVVPSNGDIADPVELGRIAWA